MRKCTPREIINAVPDIQTVILPDHWFDNLCGDRSVFVSLYQWMLADGRIPSDNISTLHGRTYVGDKLYNKLLSAEKKRLGKRLKIKGNELDRSVIFSDMNSGPKTEIGGCKIVGDLILVVPESSIQALRALSSRMFKREHEAAIDKSRANAAGATFYQWLLSQVNRPDRVGDSARDAFADIGYPKEISQYEEIKSYLESHGAPSAVIESLKEGWLEYIKQYPERVRPYAWCTDCGNRISVEDAFLAWSPESGEAFVLDLACLNRQNEYEEVESRPLSGVTHLDLEVLVEKEEISEWVVENLLEDLKLWGIIPTLTKGSIYFIRSKKTHEIKIGFTAGRIDDRLRSAQTYHPYELEVLATTSGTTEYEKALHERFARFRLKGEWFEPHPELLAFISVIPRQD